jgi:hypothetical protein
MGMSKYGRKNGFAGRLLISFVILAAMFLNAGLGSGYSQTRSKTIVHFVSDRTWEAMDPLNEVPALTLPVCLNDLNMASCPAGAKNYCWSTSGWGAILSKIPGAQWIWGFREVRGDAAEGLSEVLFRQSINLSGEPEEGVLWIAADDAASVIVNDQIAGSVGSVTDVNEASRSQSMLQSIDIRPFLRKGMNEILIQAKNGPSSFSGRPAINEVEAQRWQERGKIGPGVMGDSQSMANDLIEMTPDEDRSAAPSRNFRRSHADSAHRSGSEPGSEKNPAGVVFGGWVRVSP